ncbi:hypothetical protein E2562_031237 [Oryza meyeriana var. granulata]|uniref:Uncharacterized protein n=1 Tax=Oryza meyeriana var. granulata TaxID=110450 RepID=A0A6G1DQE9_9ORYZ|nr:hypothetical protein E2562_031237 [Oryza meyeriana var. granulata]
MHRTIRFCYGADGGGGQVVWQPFGGGSKLEQQEGSDKDVDTTASTVKACGVVVAGTEGGGPPAPAPVSFSGLAAAAWSVTDAATTITARTTITPAFTDPAISIG